MKKVLNITIGGLVFIVEEDAYEALASYLNSIKTHFSKDKDGDEIVEDIEASIAEKFGHRKNKDAAVTHRDVASVIHEMGTLKDFKKLSEEEEDEAEEKSTEKNSDLGTRKLYRDPDDVIIAGVCSGLGAYLGVETVFVRLIFFASVFFGGLGIVAYILLWILMPVAESTAQKLEMRGERITLHEIEKSVKREVDKLKKKDLSAVKNGARKIELVLQKIFHALGKIFWMLVKVLRIASGAVLILVSIAGISMLNVGLTWQITDGRIPSSPYTLSTFLPLEAHMQTVFLFSAYFTVLLPLLLALLGGYSLLRKHSVIKASTLLIFLMLWLTALGVTGTFIFDNWASISAFFQSYSSF
ncbi:PspC domain-containing protein [Candidatus Peregrinibacteria bacterium]|nr:MAG: PspC domain-containing protein [Candidatus Peregrinibacteria bacterium]